MRRVAGLHHESFWLVVLIVGHMTPSTEHRAADGRTFRARAVNAKQLNEIRLELSPIPLPLAQQTVNFAQVLQFVEPGNL